MLVNFPNIAPYRISGTNGYYLIKHFSGNHLLNIRSSDDEYFEIEGCYSYGVCDSPEQFDKFIGDTLRKNDDKFVVFFTHVKKNVGEKDGWRWHKWGEYIGKGVPTTEYLADEAEFENGVYVYHIYRVNNCDEHYVADREMMSILNMIAHIQEG